MSKASEKTRAVFMDRDGTICEERNYLSRVEDLRLFDFSAEAIRKLDEAGFLVIVTTNQSGVARGLISETALEKINEKISYELEQGGAFIHAVYVCPHSEEDGCDCRKPKIGMLQKAARAFDISLPDSWLIGDKATDIETGKNAGTKCILVRTGYGKSQESTCKSDFVVDNLSDAANLIIRHSRS